MGRVPFSAVLGISMITFACLTIFASLKHDKLTTASKEDADTTKVFAIIFAVLCALFGTGVLIGNLDNEAAARSWGVAFLGANAALIYMYYMIEPAQWLDWSPLVMLTVVVGLVLGLVIYDGDPQVETKRRENLESEINKRLAEAEETRSKWEKLFVEQKLKAVTDEKPA